MISNLERVMIPQLIQFTHSLFNTDRYYADTEQLAGSV